MDWTRLVQFVLLGSSDGRLWTKPNRRQMRRSGDRFIILGEGHRKIPRRRDSTSPSRLPFTYLGVRREESTA